MNERDQANVPGHYAENGTFLPATPLTYDEWRGEQSDPVTAADVRRIVREEVVMMLAEEMLRAEEARLRRDNAHCYDDGVGGPSER